ncbi:hypothetical protein [Streptomyces clavifer]|uniref:hypothetical protein n=1 Tax=Streptomyces clavifer TaxID=68188 RepID=UPI00365881F7
MPNPQLTTARFLSRSIEDEQRRFTHEADRLAEQAAGIAASPPAAGRTTVSGDLTRSATFLLQRAAKIKATIETAGLMTSDNPTEQ